MDDERREYIRDRLYQETNEPESQGWRDELTPEELEYAAQLDEQYETIVTATYSAILVREQVRALSASAAGWHHVSGPAGAGRRSAAG